MKRKKNSERIATPFAVRVWQRIWSAIPSQPMVVRNTYNNSVVPGKNGKFMKSSDQIPPSCDVAGYEDAKG